MGQDGLINYEKLKRKWNKIAYFVWFTIFAILALGVKAYLPAITRHVTLDYSIGISPKEGETLRNVTVYVPFPVYKGRPIKGIYSNLKETYQKYMAGDFPDATAILVNTEHGKMLKIHIPKLDKPFGVGGGCELTDWTFEKTLPQYKYQFSTSEKETVDDKTMQYVFINSDYEEGSRYLFSGKLDVNYWEGSLAMFLPINIEHARGGWATLIGAKFDDLPHDFDWGTPYYEIEINEKGWIRLPVTL